MPAAFKPLKTALLSLNLSISTLNNYPFILLSLFHFLYKWIFSHFQCHFIPLLFLLYLFNFLILSQSLFVNLFFNIHINSLSLSHLITAVTTARLLTVVVRSTHVSHGHTKVGMDVSGGWLPVATGDGLKHRRLGRGCPSSRL